MNSPSRNQPCPCGSGKKYKHCCGVASTATSQAIQTNRIFQRLVQQALHFHQRGDLFAAALLYEQAITLQPDDPGLLGLKAMLHFQQGAPDDALRLVERGLALAPNDASLHNYRGQVFSSLGQDGYAEASFVRAMQLDTNYLDAWFNAGTHFLKKHKTAQAVEVLRQASRLAPGDAEISQLLAEALFLENRLVEAEAELCRSGVGQARHGQIWLAAVLHAQGRDAEAQVTETQALAGPRGADVYAALLKVGRAHLHLGNLVAAEASFNHAIALDPANPKPYVDLAQVRKYTSEDASRVSIMENLLEKAEPELQRSLAFALGKVHADLGDFDRSFAFYRTGNDLARRVVSFDAGAYVEHIDRQIECFSAERLAAMPRGSDSDVPILVVGTPRSGTTLTESIISSHSQVAGAGEMTFWPAAMSHVMPGFPGSYTPAMSRQLAEEYLMFLRQHSGSALRITDKMPGNFMNLGIIHAVFPHAKIVHTKRHPVDACLSIYFQNFTDAHEYKWDLQSLAAWYEQYQRLMAHWRAVLPPDVLYEIQYEDLVEDQEGQSRKLLEFLGLDWEDSVLEFHMQERAVYTASKWQVRQPVYKTSKERWRRYEKHLGPLLELLKYA